MPRTKKTNYKTPQLAALMAKITDEDEEEKEVHVQHPPVSYNEFLRAESIVSMK